MIGIDSAPVRLTKTFRKPDYQRPSAAHSPDIHGDPEGAPQNFKDTDPHEGTARRPGFPPPTRRVTLETVLLETGAHQAPALIHDTLLHI